MKSEKAKKVLVVTGASGGHIFPATSFIDALIEKDSSIETLLVLPKSSIREKTLPENYRVKHISISNIGLSLDIKNLAALLNFLKGSLESLFLVASFRPDVVVGFGSLNSIPVVVFAWLMRTKTLIHEQNVVPGRANRLLSRFADKVAISFSETKSYLKIDPEKIILTGNPVRKELKRVDRSEALKFFGFEEGRFTVLVMGGSQGSHRINSCFLEAVSLFSGRLGIQVIHISGAADFDSLLEKYQDLGLKLKLFAFLKEMQYAYCASDIAISRAGATSVTELLFFGLPAIIVPYPFAYGHQMDNARILEKMGSGIIIEDDKLDAGSLRKLLEDLMNNPGKAGSMRLNFAKRTSLDARGILVKEALSFN